jgi:hypothetical protein
MWPEPFWLGDLPPIARKTESLACKNFGMFGEDHITARRGLDDPESLAGSGCK